MLEMVVFALTLVASQVLAGLLMVKVFMSKKFIKKYMKMTVELMSEAEKMAVEMLEKEEA